ncbi:hypothetical protein PR048_026787 [Dryococelus australis]|uniref:Uncharacterized protein n=1 Tax=Dryococelus australis TaxID=614101 RepID=A0ABQ9GMC6_9NEOP|nr:hypothetical protein PR048_026787 [Dryococelus australis]
MTHGMDIIQQSTNFLHPVQGVVIAMDQPLFALAKSIQWTRLNNYGEDKLFIMFGLLHIEQYFLKDIGKCLDGSGWTQMLTSAGVTHHGTAESFIKVANIAKTRLANHITRLICCEKKSENVFSGIGLDQAHEQNNAILKGDGGAVGLFTDPAALRR